MLEEEGCATHFLNIVEKFKKDYTQKKIFNGLQIQYQQIKYFTINFGLIMPMKVEIPSPADDVLPNKKNHIVYISLLKQLERMFNMPDLYAEIHRDKESQPGVYRSYEDGSRFAKNPLFIEHPKALQLHVYLDEVQICNPIGSYSHKLVFMYFTLGNLDLRYRSNHKSINLLAIFPHELVESHGYNLLKPLVD